MDKKGKDFLKSGKIIHNLMGAVKRNYLKNFNNSDSYNILF